MGTLSELPATLPNHTQLPESDNCVRVCLW